MERHLANKMCDYRWELDKRKIGKAKKDQVGGWMLEAEKVFPSGEDASLSIFFSLTERHWPCSHPLASLLCGKLWGESFSESIPLSFLPHLSFKSLFAYKFSWVKVREDGNCGFFTLPSCFLSTLCTQLKNSKDEQRPIVCLDSQMEQRLTHWGLRANH